MVARSRPWKIDHAKREFLTVTTAFRCDYQVHDDRSEREHVIWTVTCSHSGARTSAEAGGTCVAFNWPIQPGYPSTCPPWTPPPSLPRGCSSAWPYSASLARYPDVSPFRLPDHAAEHSPRRPGRRCGTHRFGWRRSLYALYLTIYKVHFISRRESATRFCLPTTHHGLP